MLIPFEIVYSFHAHHSTRLLLPHMLRPSTKKKYSNDKFSNGTWMMYFFNARHHCRIIPELDSFRSSALNGSFLKTDLETRFNFIIQKLFDFHWSSERKEVLDLTESNFSIIKNCVYLLFHFLRHINLIRRFIPRCAYWEHLIY